MDNQEKLTVTTKEYDAIVFDLDGVITQTADIHARAWKRMFDDYYAKRGERDGKDYGQMDIETDYRIYLDGKPRYDGVQSFLESRDIDLPWGSPEDNPDLETVCGLGNRKNAEYLSVLKEQGVKPFDDAVEIVKKLRETGYKTAIISSSKNCKQVLEAANMLQMFDARIDGQVAAERNIPGKPAPDVFLTAVKDLGLEPSRAIVVEDAPSGVSAGKAGNFKLVIGLARDGKPDVLKTYGADVVLQSLDQIEVLD